MKARNSGTRANRPRSLSRSAGGPRRSRFLEPPWARERRPPPPRRDDDVNSLFWLVEVRRATSHRPPARRSARNCLIRTGPARFFFAHVAVPRVHAAGRSRARPSARARDGGIGTTLNASGAPTETRTSSSSRIPRVRLVVARAPLVAPAPHPSLFLRHCTGGETIVPPSLARRRGAPRVRSPPDLPPRASRSTRDILDRT